jgi:Icc-related predicted phosphoesterase
MHGFGAFNRWWRTSCRSFDDHRGWEGTSGGVSRVCFRPATIASRLEERLRQLVSDVRLVLLHYAPIDETLQGEREQVYPFLGSYLLGEAIDAAAADIVFHGHAHHGTERGITPGGIRVRNVAKPVIGRSFNIYELPEEACSGSLVRPVAV